MLRENIICQTIDNIGLVVHANEVDAWDAQSETRPTSIALVSTKVGLYFAEARSEGLE